MLKLKELNLNGIGRFVDEQSIDFSNLGNLIQVDGQNNNTSGSSGSGKTTVFNALDYLLGLNDLPNSILQSRLTKEPISVCGKFDMDGLPLEITRSKKGLKINLNGVTIEGSSKLSEEKLDEILAMPRELFRKILHKRQKEGGFFLEFTPKQMHEFLTDCLGLGDLRKKSEIVESKLKQLQLDKLGVGNALTSQRSGLLATQDAILALGMPPVKDMHQSTILELKAKYDKSMESAKVLSSIHQEQNNILDVEKAALNIKYENLDVALNAERPQLANEPYDTSVIKIHQQSIEETRHAIQLLLNAENKRKADAVKSVSDLKMEVMNLDYKIRIMDNAKSEATRIAGEIKKIRDAICPTCEQTWVTEAAKSKESSLMEQIKVHKETLAAGMEASTKKASSLQLIEQLMPETLNKIPQELAPLQTKEKELEILINEIRRKETDFNNAQHHLNKIKLDEFAIKQKALKDKYNAESNEISEKMKMLRNHQSKEMEQANGQTEVDRRAFDIAVNKLQSYETARVRYETSLAQLKSNEDKFSKKAEELDREIIKIDQNIEMIEELKKIIKSYISCSFDDALDSIGDAATKIIRCIPNMSCATIQFEGTKVTASDKVKEEVNAVISMDGDAGIPIKSLSGGERSSVDLAVDLAVIDFIENRTGKGIDVFILDEPFTGLDTISIEMALEVLKNSNSNKKLIIVDHNPEVKEMVSSRLIVVRDGTTSKIIST